MTQIVWIARHANRLDFVNPEWFNTAKLPYDPPLSDDGVLQAQALASRLKSTKIAQIFCSPFLRTIQTAHIIAEILDLTLNLESGLGEWLNAAWMPKMPDLHSQTPAILATQYPRINWSYQSYIQPQYPETEAEMTVRCQKTVQELVANYSQDILLVGHGASVVGTTWGLVEGYPQINASLCSLVKVVRDSPSWKLELNGDTSHLIIRESTIRFI